MGAAPGRRRRRRRRRSAGGGGGGGRRMAAGGGGGGGGGTTVSGGLPGGLPGGVPSVASTFWAIVILASLLIAYCSQLAAGTCEIVTLDRDSSQPRRTIARQTARCACKKGQIAGTTRARPACVDARIIKTKQWCDMLPCLEGEGCDLLINKSGWTCTQPGGRIKTTTVS
ncbi:chemokine-like protein TAFA-5 [Tachyglossus aculeatus]|uniref:chemokine-like protein TAFA-5 n=1 Tax=Tachyglossus aculeatus TaxID=9261 RepID=UPI0018F578AF|nr:chemokine-like protein TAFA-5 [Tachyglossus aculeatus]